jgi:hypothetical protein
MSAIKISDVSAAIRKPMPVENIRQPFLKILAVSDIGPAYM